MTLNFLSQDDVSAAIDESGIGDQNVLSRWGYAATESNSLNERGDGNMDYLGDKRLSYKGLNIINGVGYNVNDAGNYLLFISLEKYTRISV